MLDVHISALVNSWPTIFPPFSQTGSSPVSSVVSLQSWKAGQTIILKMKPVCGVSLCSLVCVRSESFNWSRIQGVNSFIHTSGSSRKAHTWKSECSACWIKLLAVYTWKLALFNHFFFYFYRQRDYSEK